MTQDTSLPALAFDQVTFAYHPRHTVVREVSVRIVPGELVALLGPNGAGKSTLIRLASGVVRPTRGTVCVGGEDLRRLARDAIARRVAVVPQDFSVQFAYTVRQIVELGRMPHRGSWGVPRPADRDAIAGAMRATNTEALADRVFNELSGGERQRVLLALAIAQEGALVLLDEPTAHLDIKHQIEVLELLRRLNHERGTTVVAALHDLNLAARYFNRLVLFRNEVVADGPPARVLDDALLSEVYETRVQVGILRGEEHLSVLPPGHRGTQPPATVDGAASVHVLAGGGSGELLMRGLADAGMVFTAGPLNAGDTDCALAERLARLCIVEPPFAPISPQGIEAARERMADAEAVVVCPMPLGSGNLALLEASLAACQMGRRVLLLEPAGRLTPAALAGSAARSSAGVANTLPQAICEAITSRDFSGRGVELYTALLAAGARFVSSGAEVLAHVGGDEQALARPAGPPVTQ